MRAILTFVKLKKYQINAILYLKTEHFNVTGTVKRISGIFHRIFQDKCLKNERFFQDKCLKNERFFQDKCLKNERLTYLIY